jgi:hypothetical protein
VSFRRFLAGPVSFGLTLGLAIVAYMLNNGSIATVPKMGVVAWVGAIAAGAMSLKLDWPLLHVTAGALLLGTTWLLLPTVLWPLALAGAVFAMATARFGGLSFVSRQASRVVGIAAVAGVAWLGYQAVAGQPRLGPEGGSTAELVAAIGSLVVIVALSFWQPFSGDED